ncbi:MAG: 23S rRNA (adenine(2030)-N(6))-methyltransferase RlmJ [Burkholderiaceae bacterium]
MFSYRHAFHAGSHADVLKHMALVGVLKYLTQKDTPLTVVDTHAGAGLYRLDGDYASTSGEAKDGIYKLFNALAKVNTAGIATDLEASMAPLLHDYLELIERFNPSGGLKIYPGSPFVVHALLRQEARDKLKLFELHPTDSKALGGHIAQMEAGRQVVMARQDGFESLKALLPPPKSSTGSQRALVLIDPSYEIKSDYARVADCIADSLKRFATGTYMVWYPVIARPEAHDLPRRLKTLATQANKSWLQATLHIGQHPGMQEVRLPGEAELRGGMTASGIFIINPPHTLKTQLQTALPQILRLLGRGVGQSWSADSGG